MNTVNQHVAKELRWYESDDLHLAIDLMGSVTADEYSSYVPDTSVVSDLVDAILLTEHDLLLQCLDDWTGFVNEWRPVSCSALYSGTESDVLNSESTTSLHELIHVPRITIALNSLEGRRRSLYICIPYTDLKEMPELPVCWQSVVEIETFVINAQVGLLDSPFSVAEKDKLVPGAMVLLEQSFSDNWAVSIHKVPSKCTENLVEQLSVTLDQDSASIRLLPYLDQSSMATGSPSSFPFVSIRLLESIHINSLYAKSIWQAGGAMVLALPENLDGANVSVLVQAANDETLEQCMPGSIFRLGKGLAVLLDE